MLNSKGKLTGVTAPNWMRIVWNASLVEPGDKWISDGDKSPSSTYQQLLTVWWIPQQYFKRLYLLRTLLRRDGRGTKNHLTLINTMYFYYYLTQVLSKLRWPTTTKSRHIETGLRSTACSCARKCDSRMDTNKINAELNSSCSWSWGCA